MERKISHRLHFPVIPLFFLILLSVNLNALSKEGFNPQYLQAFNKAEEKRKAGEFAQSLELFKKALHSARKIPSRKEEASSLLKMGILYWNLGELEQSRAMYQSAWETAKKSDLSRIQEQAKIALDIHDLYNKGKDDRAQGQYQNSIESFEKAIDLARQAGSPEHELKCIRQMSITYWEMSNLQQFYFLNQNAYEIAQMLKHRKEKARSLNNIGLYFWRVDNYSKSLDNYERAFIIADQLNNIEEKLLILNNIGLIYRNIGNYDKSLDYLSQALKTSNQSKNYFLISAILNNIGNTYWNRGIYGEKKYLEKALEYYIKSLSITKNNKDEKTEIEVLNNIASLHSTLENYSKALEYFQSAYTKAEGLHYTEAMGMILNNMGVVHFNLGNYEESTKFYQKAIDLALDIGGGQILWEAYLEIGRAYAKQERYSEALESFKNSIKIIEDIRSQIQLEEFKATFLGSDKRIEAYQDLIGLLVTLHNDSPDKGYGREAFHYLEKAKARAFLDSLELSQMNLTQGIDFKLQNQEKELMKDISNIYIKLLAAEISPEEKQSLKQQLSEHENKLESLKREIRSKSPVYADLKYPEVITLEEAQKNILDSKTAFLAYSIGKDRSFAFAITKKSLEIFSLPPKERLQNLVSSYLKAVTDRDNQNFQLGHTLYNLLVQPGMNKNIENLIVIPDDILYFLPFETLITQTSKRNWLIEDCKIAYIPSISSLREIIEHSHHAKLRTRKDLLALGDPDFGSLESQDNGDVFQEFFSSNAYNFYRLSFSGAEIQRIGSLFKKNKTTVLQREKASEDSLKRLPLQDFKIIHFATHSIIDDKKPARSAIVLSLNNNVRNGKEDGFLQMREIYNLKLNSKLVTLSACQTGLGQFIKGEGIEGLNRAFFYAGASSVLMSLWAVNDQATSQLMERFYSHIRSSSSLTGALRKAKLEMIASNTASHPYYWASFIVSGRADQVLFPGISNKWLFLGAFFLLAVGIAITAARRNRDLPR